MKTIKKSAHINAAPEKVWEVLFTDQYYRQWAAEFMEGSHFETDWKVGSNAIFKDESNNGLVAKILENVANEYLSMEHYAEYVDGNIDETTEMAQQLKGNQEIYSLHGHDDHTHLDIESDVADEWYEGMNEGWDKALEKIKELAESL